PGSPALLRFPAAAPRTSGRPRSSPGSRAGSIPTTTPTCGRRPTAGDCHGGSDRAERITMRLHLNALFAAVLMRRGMVAPPWLVSAAALALFVAALCLPPGLSASLSGRPALFSEPVPCLTCLIGAFDCGAALFVGSVLWKMFGASLTDMKTLANIEDENRNTSLVIGSIVATITLLAVFGELGNIGRVDTMRGLHLGLAIATIVLSWSFMNCMFAQHYAHEYYRDFSPWKPRAGLIFPGAEEPDYWDFLYFSFVIGMTFQVSDVQVADRGLRRTVLIHGLLAFLFNVLVLSLTINIVAGLVSSGHPVAARTGPEPLPNPLQDRSGP